MEQGGKKTRFKGNEPSQKLRSILGSRTLRHLCLQYLLYLAIPLPFVVKVVVGWGTSTHDSSNDPFQDHAHVSFFSTNRPYLTISMILHCFCLPAFFGTVLVGLFRVHLFRPRSVTGLSALYSSELQPQQLHSPQDDNSDPLATEMLGVIRFLPRIMGVALFGVFFLGHFFFYLYLAVEGKQPSCWRAYNIFMCVTSVTTFLSMIMVYWALSVRPKVMFRNNLFRTVLWLFAYGKLLDFMDTAGFSDMETCVVDSSYSDILKASRSLAAAFNAHSIYRIVSLLLLEYGITRERDEELGETKKGETKKGEIKKEAVVKEAAKSPTNRLLSFPSRCILMMTGTSRSNEDVMDEEVGIPTYEKGERGKSGSGTMGSKVLPLWMQYHFRERKSSYVFPMMLATFICVLTFLLIILTLPYADFILYQMMDRPLLYFSLLGCSLFLMVCLSRTSLANFRELKFLSVFQGTVFVLGAGSLILLLLNDSYQYVLRDLGNSNVGPDGKATVSALQYAASFGCMAVVFALSLLSLPRMIRLNVDTPEKIVAEQCNLSVAVDGERSLEGTLPKGGSRQQSSFYGTLDHQGSRRNSGTLKQMEPLWEPEMVMCSCCWNEKDLERVMHETQEMFRVDHSKAMRKRLRILMQGLGYAAQFQRVCYSLIPSLCDRKSQKREMGALVRGRMHRLTLLIQLVTCLYHRLLCPPFGSSHWFRNVQDSTSPKAEIVKIALVMLEMKVQLRNYLQEYVKPIVAILLEFHGEENPSFEEPRIASASSLVGWCPTEFESLEGLMNRLNLNPVSCFPEVKDLVKITTEESVWVNSVDDLSRKRRWCSRMLSNLLLPLMENLERWENLLGKVVEGVRRTIQVQDINHSEQLVALFDILHRNEADLQTSPLQGGMKSDLQVILINAVEHSKFWIPLGIPDDSQKAPLWNIVTPAWRMWWNVSRESSSRIGCEGTTTNGLGALLKDSEELMLRAMHVLHGKPAEICAQDLAASVHDLTKRTSLHDVPALLREFMSDVVMKESLQERMDTLGPLLESADRWLMHIRQDLLCLEWLSPHAEPAGESPEEDATVVRIPRLDDTEASVLGGTEKLRPWKAMDKLVSALCSTQSRDTTDHDKNPSLRCEEMALACRLLQECGSALRRKSEGATACSRRGDSVSEAMTGLVQNACVWCVPRQCLSHSCTNSAFKGQRFGGSWGLNMALVAAVLYSYFCLLLLLCVIFQEQAGVYSIADSTIFLNLLRVFSLQWIKFVMEVLLQCLFFEVVVKLRLATLSPPDLLRLHARSGPPEALPQSNTLSVASAVSSAWASIQ